MRKEPNEYFGQIRSAVQFSERGVYDHLRGFTESRAFWSRADTIACREYLSSISDPERLAHFIRVPPYPASLTLKEHILSADHVAGRREESRRFQLHFFGSKVTLEIEMDTFMRKLDEHCALAYWKLLLPAIKQCQVPDIQETITDVEARLTFLTGPHRKIGQPQPPFSRRPTEGFLLKWVEKHGRKFLRSEEITYFIQFIWYLRVGKSRTLVSNMNPEFDDFWDVHQLKVFLLRGLFHNGANYDRKAMREYII